MMKKIVAVLNALKYGQELKDPAKWKQGQELTNLVGGLIAAIIALIKANYPNFELPLGAEEHIEGIVIGALILINIYYTRATTKKIGFGSPKESKEKA